MDTRINYLAETLSLILHSHNFYKSSACTLLGTTVTCVAREMVAVKHFLGFLS